MPKTKLMLLGPPGAGKGTQAERITEALEIPHISTGDILRDARDRGTELGKKAAEYMNAGELVPDDVVIGIVEERLEQDDAQGGFVLDGFPRTLNQAEALDGQGVELDAVLSLEVSESEVVRRLSGRLHCPECGAGYHKSFDPPQTEDVCDECGHQGLERRKDDQPEVIRERMKTYEENTDPLKSFYADRGVLVRIDGEGSPEAVAGRIAQAIDAV